MFFHVLFFLFFVLSNFIENTRRKVAILKQRQGRTKKSSLVRIMNLVRDLEAAQGAVSEEARGGTERGGGAFAPQGGDVEDEASGTDALDVPFSLASRAMFR